MDATVFRKLKGLGHVTSFSHRGRYYTLSELAQFDDRGLWWFRGVGFSKYGTLLSTIEAFVNGSEAGCWAWTPRRSHGVGANYYCEMYAPDKARIGIVALSGHVRANEQRRQQKTTVSRQTRCRRPRGLSGLHNIGDPGVIDETPQPSKLVISMRKNFA